jgi:molybdopterin molybdotransferase
MTATADAEAAANELMPLAEYLGSVLRRLRALPPLDLDLTQAHGNVLANDVLAPHPYPAFDQSAIDGYAARW